MESIAKMIGIMFMSRTHAHMCHLKTGSYAKHVALNKFYDGILGFADSLAEVSQGKYGKLDIPYVDMKGDVGDPTGSLETHLTMLENLGKRLEEAYLDNIFQEIQSLYRSTIYKLKELA